MVRTTATMHEKTMNDGQVHCTQNSIQVLFNDLQLPLLSRTNSYSKPALHKPQKINNYNNYYNF